MTRALLCLCLLLTPAVAELELGPPVLGSWARDVEWSGLPPGTKEPFYEFEPVRRGKIKLAESWVAVVLEGEERLWIDHDGDGDLRNDPWPVYERLPTRRQREVELSLKRIKERVQSRVRFYTVSDWGVDHVKCMVISTRRGKFRVGNRKILVAFEDHDSDAEYLSFEDCVYIDWNGDGRFEVARDSTESFHGAVTFDGDRLLLSSKLLPVPDIGKRFPIEPARLYGEHTVLLVKPAQEVAALFTRWVEIGRGEVRAGPGSPLFLVDHQATILAKHLGPTSLMHYLRVRDDRDPVTNEKRGSPTSLDQLHKRVREERSVGAPLKLRTRTFREIASYGNIRGAKILRDAALAAEEDLEVRIAATRALGEVSVISPPLLKEIYGKAKEEELRVAAVRAVAGDPSKAAVTLLAEALRKDRSLEVRRAAIKRLAQAGSKDALKAVERALKENIDLEMFGDLVAGVDAFDGPKQRKAVEKILLQGVTSDEQRIRAPSIKALARRKHPKMYSIALHTLQDRNAGGAARTEAVRALAALETIEAYKVLLQVIAKSRGGVRAAAERAILEPPSPEIADWLLKEGLAHGNAGVRRVAVRSLGGVRRSGVAPALHKMLADKNKGVRMEAIAAVARQRDPAPAADLLKLARQKEDPELRAAAMSALGRIEPEGDEVEAILLGLLKDGSVEERILAAEHAAKARSMAALPALLENLQHASMPVRSASVQALAKIRARQSIEPLIDSLGRETGRMKDEIARGLYAVTGLPYYDLVDVWRKWWAKEGASFKLPAEDPPPFDPERKGNYY
ncbi:MAG: HEAT repeat domain-containing protein, partial [Planctomycetota bacterium]